MSCFIANIQKWAYNASGFNKYGMKYSCIIFLCIHYLYYIYSCNNYYMNISFR